MNRDAVLKSARLKKKFVKDNNLSISVYDEPYFTQRLYTIDRFAPCVSSFSTYIDELERFSDDTEYLEYRNQVEGAAIQFIKSSPKIESFKGDQLNFNHPDAKKWSKRTLYANGNDGKTFISIDMNKSNFNSLRHYAPEIVDNAHTWYEFISKFTDLQHLRDSSHLRHCIFSVCGHYGQMKYVQYLMNILLNHIQDNLHVNVYSLTADEILLDVSDGEKWSLNKLRETIESCPDGIGEMVRVSMFNLNQLNNDVGWYKIMYQLDDPLSDMQDEIILKCVESDIYHQVIKHYFDDKITDDDLVFCHKGKLAKYLEGIEDPW